VPIYEYACDSCGERFEWLVRAGEEPSCPACGKTLLSKLISLPAGHVAKGKSSPCPGRESGACAMSSQCSRGRCDLSQWL